MAGIGADEAAIIVMIVIFSIIGLGIGLFVLWLYYSAFATIPPEYRMMNPGQVFLVLIPLFGAIWIFYVVIRLSRSFQYYFSSIGRYDVGDCGYRTGLTSLILQWVGMVPFIGPLFSIGSLVMMIIYLVKISQLKSMVRFHELQGAAPEGAGVPMYGGGPQMGGLPPHPYSPPGPPAPPQQPPYGPPRDR